MALLLKCNFILRLSLVGVRFSLISGRNLIVLAFSG